MCYSCLLNVLKQLVTQSSYEFEMKRLQSQHQVDLFNWHYVCLYWLFATESYIVPQCKPWTYIASQNNQTYPSNGAKQEKVEWAINITTAIVNSVWLLGTSESYLMSKYKIIPFTTHWRQPHLWQWVHSLLHLCEKGTITYHMLKIKLTNGTFIFPY